MKYKLAIFDFDGTLADTLPWFLSAVNRAWGYTHVEALEAHVPAEVFAGVAEVVEKVALGELPYES